MKKSLLFSAVLAGLMLGSCSSSDDLAGGNTSANQDGKGYVAFTINLPSQSGSSSRASNSTNDQFNDGMATEYAVKDATLILFNGSTTEGESSFVEAHKLSTTPWTNQNPADDNITTQSKKIVQKVTKSITNAKALVILNNNNTLTVGDDGTLKVNGTEFTGTYAEFLALADATSGKTLTADGFYMANAPLANGQGGSAAPATGTTVTTLTDLTDKIYDTEAEAQLGTPAEVYVERGVAKVTVNKGTVDKADNGTPAKVSFEVTGWAIDNINPTTYLVRSIDGFSGWMSYANEKVTTNPYRFVGHTEIASGLYRTYFAKDMNYDTEVAANYLNRVTDADFKDTYGAENPQYCFENTFDVKHQNENQTTLVAIKAKLNSGVDFYIVGGDQTTLYTKTELENLIKSKFLSVEEAWIKNNAKDATTTIGGDDLTLTFDKDAAGEINLTNVAVKPEKLKTSTTALPTTWLTDVKAAVGSVVCYKGGVSYYTVRIKHFGDDLTPWKNGELDVKPGSVYPDGTKTAENNWLGRYGVLRNNWYDIEVTGVKGLGSATIPELTGTTDDELESYIAVRINVLSWAKRTQGAVLH